MPKTKADQPPQDDQDAASGTEGTPPVTEETQSAGDTSEAGATPRRVLKYSTPEELADGRIRIRASDGKGNTLTVSAEDKVKAQASLRAGFKALHGDD